MLAFKWFRRGLRGAYQSSFSYPPPGQWTKRETPRICHSGYHVMATLEGGGRFAPWESPSDLWLVECRGRFANGSNCNSDKVAFEQIRLVRKLPLDFKSINKMRTTSGMLRTHKRTNLINGPFTEQFIGKLSALWSLNPVVLKRNLQHALRSAQKGRVTRLKRKK